MWTFTHVSMSYNIIFHSREWFFRNHPCLYFVYERYLNDKNVALGSRHSHAEPYNTVCITTLTKWHYKMHDTTKQTSKQEQMKGNERNGMEFNQESKRRWFQLLIIITIIGNRTLEPNDKTRYRRIG